MKLQNEMSHDKGTLKFLDKAEQPLFGGWV